MTVFVSRLKRKLRFIHQFIIFFLLSQAYKCLKVISGLGGGFFGDFGDFATFFLAHAVEDTFRQLVELLKPRQQTAVIKTNIL